MQCKTMHNCINIKWISISMSVEVSACYSDSESISGLSGVEPISKYSQSVARTAWKRWGAQRAQLLWIIRTKARMHALWYHSPRICTDFWGGIIAKRPHSRHEPGPPNTPICRHWRISWIPGKCCIYRQQQSHTHRKIHRIIQKQVKNTTKAKAYNAMNQISD